MLEEHCQLLVRTCSRKHTNRHSMQERSSALMQLTARQSQREARFSRDQMVQLAGCW